MQSNYPSHSSIYLSIYLSNHSSIHLFSFFTHTSIILPPIQLTIHASIYLSNYSYLAAIRRKLRCRG